MGTFQWGDARLDSFHSKPFKWDKIREKSKYIEVFQSTNDIIPVTEGTRIANNLNARLTVVKNANHFNLAENSSYDKFPLLLSRIKKRL